MNLLITIGSISPYITNLRSDTGVGFGNNSGDGIPPINIGRLCLFDIGMLHLANRRAPVHGAVKSESENPEFNSIFKNAWCKNNFEVETFGRKNSVILNHVDSNYINTVSNHANSNHDNSDKLITAYLTTINDSAGFCELNKLLSWDRYSVEEADSKVSMRTSLYFVPSIHTSHTQLPVQSFHSYPTVPALRVVTYGTSDPT